jgi:hypothetical protein
VQIPQVITIQTSAPYEVESGLLLYSENGISVIVIEDKTLSDGEGVRTYYVDFIASQLPPDAVVIMIYPPPIVDRYVVVGIAPQGLRSILTTDVPKLESVLFTDNVALGLKYATAEDILRQFAIWTYMGVDLASLKGYWLLIGLSEAAWNESEGWLAGFAKSSSAVDITDLPHGVSADYEPHGYSRVTIILTNSRHNHVYVRAKVGTILNNANKSNQNITIGETGAVLLPAGVTKRMTLESYCVNARRGVPTRTDTLAPTIETNEELSKLLSRAAAPATVGREYSQRVIQEAVWHITDGTGIHSAEARALLADNTEVRTWEDVATASGSSESSASTNDDLAQLAAGLSIALVMIAAILYHRLPKRNEKPKTFVLFTIA